MKYFTVGDKVEYVGGITGKVFLVYREIKTNAPVGCAIEWKDKTISTFLPVNNLGSKFNPFIRRKVWLRVFLRKLHIFL